MGRTAINLARPSLMHNAYSLRKRTGSVNFIVYDKCSTPLDITNNTHRLRHPIIAKAALLYYSERGTQTISQLARLLSETFISSHDRQIGYVLFGKVASLNDLRS